MKSGKRVKILSMCLISTLFLSIIPINVNARMRIHYNKPYNEWPKELQGAQDDNTVKKGYIDITKAPYNAKGDGITDDTQAIQKAVNDGFNNNLTVYFPADKVFLVSKSISIEQKNLKDLGINFEVGRKFGNILIGGVDGKERPKIKLKDNVKDDKKNIVLNFYKADTEKNGDSGAHYMSTFKGIDIELGNNEKWNGISMDGAQLCSIADTKITGKSFNAGAINIPGNGTKFTNVEVVGGKYGIYQDAYRPSIIVTGFKCINQSNAGIYVQNTRGGMTVVGFDISNESAPKGYTGVKLKEEKGAITDGTPTRASIILRDGKISAGNETAIYNYNQTIVVENVFVKATNGIISGEADKNPDKVATNSSKWSQIQSYAFTSAADGAAYFNKVNNNKEINNLPKQDYVAEKNVVEAKQVPNDLVTKHTYQYKDIPTLGSNSVSINEFGATPDKNDDDDSIAIQKAIDAVTTKGNKYFGKAVFIPRGHYNIKKTITFKSGLKIFGVGKNSSVIQTDKDWTPKSTTVAVDTEDVAKGNLVLSEFAILGLRQDDSNKVSYEGYGNKAHQNTILFRLRTNNTIMSDVMITRVEGGGKPSEFYKEPMVLFAGNAGGKIYNSIVYDTSTSTSNGNISGDYRVALFDGVKNKLSVYGINGVHAFHRAEGSNIEVKNSSNIDLYAMKTESINTYFKIVNSSDISVYGCAGTSHVDDSNIDSKVLIANSNNIKIANFSHDGLAGLYGPSEKDKPWIKIYYGDEIYNIGKDTKPILLLNFKSEKKLEKDKYINFIKNPSFEQGNKNWTSDNSKLEVQKEHPYEGDYSVKITNRNGNNDVIAQDVTDLLKGKTNISFASSARFKTEWEKEPGTENIATMNIKVKMENGKYKEFKLGDKILKKEKASQEAEDKYLNHWYNIYGKIEVNTPSPIVEAKIYFTFTDTKVNLYFDDIVLTQNKDNWLLHGNEFVSTKNANFLSLSINRVISIVSDLWKNGFYLA